MSVLFLRLDRGELEAPGAVGKLVSGVQSFLVGPAGLDHLPEDPQPTLSQTAQRTGMALALLALASVVRRRPRTLAAAEVAVAGLMQAVKE